MIKVLLACRDSALFLDMIDAFQSRSVRIDPMQSGSSALTMMADGSYHLLITDEHLPDMTGKALIEKTITLNPFINCVAVSTLSHKRFHDEYEGLGVLMQLPPTPDTADVQKLLDHLDKIHLLLKK
ncbi:MAG: hypothetical protein KKE44_06770 [Proteobacteria bacterium]|nr:hypothetical protein [Pseudomonadota bacterium]MBU1582431.1 hypothetical protein [Pseudomonadota bacterium]MBU2453771.1 hypothetical protein [Pseudomonadota bacterium]